MIGLPIIWRLRTLAFAALVLAVFWRYRMHPEYGVLAGTFDLGNKMCNLTVLFLTYKFIFLKLSALKPCGSRIDTSIKNNRIREYVALLENHTSQCQR